MQKSYQMMDLANESGTKMFLLGFEIQGDPAELEYMFQNLRTVDFGLDESVYFSLGFASFSFSFSVSVFIYVSVLYLIHLP